jgi:GGDEF domain-containing protein
VAVVVESFFNNEGNINILNTAIPFSILIYYLYLNIEKAELDNSTCFYNREVYNAKVDKINEIVKGVILFKIPLDNNPDNVDVYNKNNDDIKHISAIILHNISRKMIVYRLEDNMFFLVTNDSNTKTVLDIYDRIKKQLYEHSYKVDIGYAFRTGKNELIHELYLEADRMIRTAKRSYNGNTTTMKKIF